MLAPQERLQHLVEDLNDAVYTVDLDTNAFTSLNTAGQRLIGYSLPEIVGQSIAKIIAPEYLETVRNMIHMKLQSDKATVYEIEIIRKDGQRVPVEISSRILRAKGKPTEILGIARNITERKQAERQKEIFFSLITHEIKNPLTSIQVYAQLLGKMLTKTSKEAEMLTVIQAQVAAITQLMSDFIEVNQLQMGRFTITKAPFDLNETVKDVISTFVKDASGHTIERKGTIRNKITGDEQRIRQVLINLLSNAIKYSPENKKVTITLSQTKRTAVITVRDLGIGIPKAEQKAIFDLFYRIRHETTQSIHGHGLGLYICKEIISSHKGTLTVMSTPGKGSTFSFTLPL
jgi:PAS domain S-box-containing protein